MFNFGVERNAKALLHGFDNMIFEREDIGGGCRAVGIDYNKGLEGPNLCAANARAFQSGMVDKPRGRNFHQSRRKRKPRRS